MLHVSWKLVKKLSHAWFGACCCGFCFQDLDTLLVWIYFHYVKWSQNTRIFVWTERIEHDAEKMDKDTWGFWFHSIIIPMKGERCGERIELPFSVFNANG